MEGNLKNLTDYKKGDRVVYIPKHAYGDISHPDAKAGTVSSVTIYYIFVRFDIYVERLGWKGATSQACRIEDLIKL